METILDITIDTREQTPWHFDECFARTNIGTLRIGDYALLGDLGFAVERKSLDDFLGTVSSGWSRFKKEIARATTAGFIMPIIVEGRLQDCLFSVDEDGNPVPPQHNHPRLTPGFVLKRIGELHHMGATVFFAENPHFAMAVAYSMLKERHLITTKQRLFDEQQQRKQA